MLDQPASTAAFWAIYDDTGIRPEWLIPVLSYESGLNPGVQNEAGALYYGIGQNSAEAIAAAGTDPSTYLTWSASSQLSRVVGPYFNSIVKQYGKLESGIQVYQAEFYPASLKYARGLDDVIVARPAAAYEANKGFDKAGKGYITPRDLANAVASQVPKAAVQAALGDAYAARPGQSMTDPVFGNTGNKKIIWALTGIFAAAGAAYIYVELEGPPRWLPKPLRRALI